jgi:predicted RNA methylase
VNIAGTRRHLTDKEFDNFFPYWARKLSTVHWTPVHVARHAAHLLVDKPGISVLDVGCGVGKFCILGALIKEANFVGVERRERLVNAAKELVRKYSLPRVEFKCADVMAMDWSGFDSIYLFNPFGENISDQHPMEEITTGWSYEAPVLSRRHYEKFVMDTHSKLASLKPSARVVTYHGYGCGMPSEFTLQSQSRHGEGMLELWIKK